MVRFCVVHASDQRLLKCAVASVWPESFLMDVSKARIGVGYYNGDEVLLIRRPTIAQVTLDSLLEPVTGNHVLVALETSTSTRFSPWGIPPFRYRNYIGVWSIERTKADDFVEQVLLHVPEYLAKEVKVGDPGELFFYLVLSYLHDMGKLSHREVPKEALTDAVLSALRLLPKLARRGPKEKPPLTAGVISNGEHVVAGVVGGDLFLLQQHGIERCPLCSEPERSPTHDPKYVAHTFLKVTSIAFLGGGRKPECYGKIGGGQVLTLGQGGDLSSTSAT